MKLTGALISTPQDAALFGGGMAVTVATGGTVCSVNRDDDDDDKEEEEEEEEELWLEPWLGLCVGLEYEGWS